MSKIRTERNKDYTLINNTIARDPRLSWKAKGIFLYAFSRPEEWEFYVEDLIKHSTDGEKSTKAGLRELEKFGYLRRTQGKNKSGHFEKVDWVLYETPEDFKKCLPEADFRPAVFGPAGERRAVKDGLISIEDISKDISIENTEGKKKEGATAPHVLLFREINLSPEEKQKLLEIAKGDASLVQTWENMLADWKADRPKSKHRKSDYKAILKWVIDAERKARAEKESIILKEKENAQRKERIAKYEPPKQEDQKEFAKEIINRWSSEHFRLEMDKIGIAFVPKNPQHPTEYANYGADFLRDIKHLLQKKGFKNVKKEA